MDRAAGARKLIGELVKGEQIEVRRAEIVGRDLAKLVESLKRPPTGQELGEWLDEHPQVTGMYAATALLDELVDRHFADAETAVIASRDPELEREIRGAPESSAPYLVYADWLQEHQDPLGELISLGVASASGDADAVARFERFLVRHDAYVLGGLAPRLAGRVALRWRYGFVQRIEEIGEPVGSAVWEQLLGLRVCALVEAITLRHPPAAELDAVLARAAPEAMQTLTLEASLGALPASLLRRPLRALAIQSAYTLALEQHTLPSTLERLELRAAGVAIAASIEVGVRELAILLAAPTTAFLSTTRWPRLETLTLYLAGAPATAVPALLSALELPSLRHLVVAEGRLDEAAFAALAKLPLAARLTALGLVDLELTDETFAPISGTRGFTSLAEVDVSWNELTSAGIATAQELARTVTSTRQHRRGHGRERRVRAFAGTQLQPAELISDPKAWRRAGIDGDVRWARYRGDSDYELFVTTDLSRFGCSCGSAVVPCKHVVALALIAERTPLSPAPSHGIELRVAGAGLTELLRASIDD